MTATCSFQYGQVRLGQGQFFEVDFNATVYSTSPILKTTRYSSRDSPSISTPRTSTGRFFNVWSNSFANIEEFEKIILASDGYQEAVLGR